MAARFGEPHLAEGREGQRDTFILWIFFTRETADSLWGGLSTAYTRLLFVSALEFLRISVRGALKSVDA